MSDRPAYYAARSGGWRDWWTLLHPPYTAWHLSYVVIGAGLAPRVSLSHLLYAVAAFFLAVGVAAHALDELHGRPRDGCVDDAARVRKLLPAAVAVVDARPVGGREGLPAAVLTIDVRHRDPPMIQRVFP